MTPASGFRLSPQQRRAWFTGKLGSWTTVRVQINGPVDSKRLRNALVRVMAPYEVLRTSFRLLDGASLPVQVIHEGPEIGETLPHGPIDVEDSANQVLVGMMLTPLNNGQALTLRISGMLLDATSARLVLTELAKAYGSESSEESTECQPPIQYADVAEIFNDLLEGEDSASGREFWTRHHWPERLLHRPRFMNASNFVNTSANDAAFDSTRQLVQPKVLGLTSAALLTIWRWVLAQTMDHNGPVIGVEVSGRNYEELVDGIGPFARFLPFDQALDPTQSSAEIVEVAANHLAELVKHADFFDFPKDIEGAYFPLIFADRDGRMTQRAGDVTFQLTGLESEPEAYELGMYVTRFERAIELRVASRGIADGEMWTRELADRFIAAVEDYLDRPDAPLITNRSFHHGANAMLARFNATTRDLVHQQSLFPTISNQAEAIPEVLALCGAGGDHSYADLVRRASVGARVLRSHGIGPGQIVGVQLGREVDLVVALLAISAAGAAFLPLDPTYPTIRIQFMIADSGADLIISREPSLCENVTIWDPALLARSIQDTPLPDVHTLMPAYLLYTSGSTGKPKGTLVSHHGLMHYLAFAKEAYVGEVGSGCVPLHSPIGFDLTLTSLLLPLVSGLTIDILPDGSGIETLMYLRDRFEAGADYTFVKLTPSHLRALADMHSATAVGEAARCFIIGGEALQRRDVCFWQQQAPAIKLVNEYGPTETVVGCCVHRVQADEVEPLPIGRPIDRMRLYVADSSLRLVPSAVVGELYIAGEGLAFGYLGRPRMTAARFIPDPWSTEPGARLYRTGDLAWMDGDCRLRFVGRNDEQVKLRGNRIELGEIRRVLREFNDITEADVIVRENARGEQMLVGFVCGDNLDTETILANLRRHLPEAMLPASIQVLERLPLTPNGKVDRQALLKRPLVGVTAVEDGDCESSVGELLRQVWCDVLNRDEETVGIDTPFFDLGGHSLLLIRIHVRLMNLFAVDIPLNALFDAATIRRMVTVVVAAAGASAETMAARILELLALPDAERQALVDKLALPTASASNSSAWREQIPIILEREGLHDHSLDNLAGRIESQPNETPAPLSFAQQRLWFFDQIKPQSPLFNAPWAFRLRGPLDPEILADAFTKLSERHAVLRTTFSMVDGEPRQVVQPVSAHPLPLNDLSKFAELEKQNRLQAAIHDEAHTGFDLVKGPVWRTQLLRLAENEHVLMVTMHHICTDARSVDIIVGETAEIYRAAKEDREPQLRPLPIQYTDYARWQLRHWQDSSQAGLAFWRDHLADVALDRPLATDHPRREEQTFQGDTLSIQLDKAWIDRCEQFAREQDASLFMLLHTAFAAALQLHDPQDRVVVGTDFANRERDELEPLVGFFVNQLPLCLDFSRTPTLSELLQRNRQVAIAAFQHGDVPFDRIVKALQVDRTAGFPPLFQAKLFLEHAADLSGENIFPGIVIETLESRLDAARIDLTMGLTLTGDGLQGWLNYNRDLFDPATAARMLTRFKAVLQAMLQQPDATWITVAQKLREQEQAADRVQRGARRKSNLAKFKKGRRKTQVVTTASAELVREQGPPTGNTLPIIFTPSQEGVDLADWMTANKDRWQMALHRAGAILFRGFGVDNVPLFDRFGKTVLTHVFKDNGEHQPVSADRAVQVPVDYAAEQFLLWHSENTFNLDWPSRIIFGCAQPSETGGETPLVDNRALLAKLPEDVRNRFLEKGLMYVRNYSEALGLSWQKVFNTQSRKAVEAILHNQRFDWTWQANGQLRTRACRPAAVKHPATGELCWVNQAQHWHVSCLDKHTRAAYQKLFSEEDYPRNCYYGDGTLIADEDMATIMAAYREVMVAEPWQRGDVIVVDNALAAHARNPYTGKRKLLVIMGDLLNFAELKAYPPMSDLCGQVASTQTFSH